MSNNYIYIKCDDCSRRGTPKCRHKGKRWPACVIPGCCVKVEDADSFMKQKSKQEAESKSKHKRVSESDTPMANIAYTIHEMRESVKNRMTAAHEMTADERAVEKFLKDMMADYANIIDRNYRRIGEAVLDFCNAFTLVYPPNDKDCPALLAGAFEEFKEAMGIETVKREEGEG